MTHGLVVVATATVCEKLVPRATRLLITGVTASLFGSQQASARKQSTRTNNTFFIFLTESELPEPEDYPVHHTPTTLFLTARITR